MAGDRGGLQGTPQHPTQTRAFAHPHFTPGGSRLGEGALCLVIKSCHVVESELEPRSTTAGADRLRWGNEGQRGAVSRATHRPVPKAFSETVPL